MLVAGARKTEAVKFWKTPKERFPLDVSLSAAFELYQPPLEETRSFGTVEDGLNYYRDNGNCYSILGLYRDNGKEKIHGKKRAINCRSQHGRGEGDNWFFNKLRTPSV